MNKEFMGRGLSFPFHFDPATGGVAFSAFEENIRQNVTIIIGTRVGERQMMPTYGCRIHELLFAPSNQVTAQRATKYVREALERWELRIEVLQVESTFDPSGAIQVQLAYRIRSTGAVEHLSQIVSSQ
jgi:uncharacterized protein